MTTMSKGPKVVWKRDDLRIVRVDAHTLELERRTGKDALGTERWDRIRAVHDVNGRMGYRAEEDEGYDHERKLIIGLALEAEAMELHALSLVRAKESLVGG